MSKLEVTLLVFAFVTLVVSVEFVRRRTLLEGFALLWMGVGLGAVGLAVGRSLVDAIARSLGVTYGANLILGAGIVFLLLVCMVLSVHVSRLDARVEILAEEVAFLRSRHDDPPLPPVDPASAGGGSAAT
jgi:hypothetical protein